MGCVITNNMPSHIIIHVYTDGACRGNPGRSAIGIVFLDSKQNLIAEYKECIGNQTNNEAEYAAIIKALELATAYCRRHLSVFSDSELVINHINGRYALKADNLRPLFYLVKDRERAFEKVIYNNCPRDHKHAKHADRLANEALDDK